MYRDKISPQDVCDLLNELLSKDPECIKTLINSRVPCNSEIVGHSTVQVRDCLEMNKSTVGLIGILNGLFGINDEDGFGAIGLLIDEGTMRFELTDQYKSRCPACKGSGLVDHGISGISYCSCKKGQSLRNE